MSSNKNQLKGNPMTNSTLQKETGYDAFLAKKIAKGREDVKNGRYVTLEELDKHIQELFICKERELQLFDIILDY